MTLGDLPLNTTRRVEELPEDIEKHKIPLQDDAKSDCVEPANKQNALQDTGNASKTALKDSESLEILHFRRVHINSTTLARGVPFASRSSYGILRTEPINSDWEGHRCAKPYFDRVDGEQYVCNNIRWLIRKVRTTSSIQYRTSAFVLNHLLTRS